MYAQCLYQSNTADLGGMSRQRKACLRAVRKLQWHLTGAEHGEFDTLLISDPQDLQCEPQELEALLSVLNAHDIHVFGCQRGRWVEQGGRHFSPLPKLSWAEDEILLPTKGVVS